MRPRPRPSLRPELGPEGRARVYASLLVAAVLVCVPWVGRKLRAPPGLPTPSCGTPPERTADGWQCPPVGVRASDPIRSLWLGQRLDLATADAAALTVVPGIGPSLAARIVADRNRNGPFPSVASVARVRGIGPRLARRISLYAEVRGPASVDMSR